VPIEKIFEIISIGQPQAHGHKVFQVVRLRHGVIMMFIRKDPKKRGAESAPLIQALQADLENIPSCSQVVEASVKSHRCRDRELGSND
jgi:hypothetical protein